MKIKVDKEEYELLIERVRELEKHREAEWEHFRRLENHLQRYMEDYFEHKCMTVMVKRDRNMIMAEVRKNVMDSLFKEKE